MQYLRIVDLKWYEEKKRKEEKMRKKMKLYRRKMSDWNAKRKMNDWSAKSYEAAWNDRKNVVSMRDNCGGKTRDRLRTTELYDFDNFDDEELDDEFDHLIDDFIDLIVNDIKRWYDYLDDASWCYHLLQWTQSYEM